MAYLNLERMAGLDAAAFRHRYPYPWVNPEGLLTEDGYRSLREALPELSQFERNFDKPRKYGQQSHNRFSLQYREGLALPEPWQAFITELQGPDYRAFLRRMLGSSAFELDFHWHYTPQGCSVSPHCDANWKLGSHIFYFNTPDDWDPSWGGETVILDDGGRFSRRSAPQFADFERQYPTQALGNYSLLFIRRGNSWHGVREIDCPEGAMRKVFIVVIRRPAPAEYLRRLVPQVLRAEA